MPPKKQKIPFQRFLENGLTGEESKEIVLDCLTRLSLGKETTRVRQERQAELWEELTYGEDADRQLIRALSTIVLEGLRVRFDMHLMSNARWEAEREARRRKAARKDFLVLRTDPTRWFPQGIPTRRPRAGNPFLPLVPWAKDLLLREAGIKAPVVQNDLLRLIGLPAQPSA